MPAARPRHLVSQATVLAFIAVVSVPRFVPATSPVGEPAALDPRLNPDGGSAGAKQAADSVPKTPIQIYRAVCLKCHDSDGKGEIVRDTLPKIPDFTDAKWHASHSDAELSRSILEGKAKSMPRMKDKLGATDVKHIVAFVRAFRGGKQVVEEEPEAEPAPAEPARDVVAAVPGPRPVESLSAAPNSERRQAASRLFRRFCVRCHADDGKGTDTRASLPMIPDFTSRAWQVWSCAVRGHGGRSPRSPFRPKHNSSRRRP